MTHLETELCF